MSAPAVPEGYAVSADPGVLDFEVIHGFISQSYWAKSIPRATIEKMIENSLCFGAYYRGAQVGFARIISDYATFAYLADVFILPDHRDRGLGKALMETIMAHPNLQDLRRWMLVTLDAHGLYEQYGFKSVVNPERHMEIHCPSIYESGSGIV